MSISHPLRILLVFTLLFSTAAWAGGYNKSDAKPAMEAKPSIVEIAAGNEDFSTLVAALQAADLVGVLEGEGPFTVFAPTNAAFAALPEGTLDSLLKPENKQQLIDILTYHVLPGAVYAADVTQLSSATTVQGSNVDIMTSMGKVKIDNAQVVTTDIKASNGVIHVIDAVILPQSDELAAR
jgi:uncharacterized surface protein with fasciclin (FAS1) repeats